MNRDKVIKGLECCTFILGKRKCNECPYQKDNGCYQLQDDFHTLLKEQEEKIKNRDGSLEKAREEIKWLRGMLKGQEAVVRCKDCKFWNNDGIITTCEKHIGNGYPGDWFCADGERKNGND